MAHSGAVNLPVSGKYVKLYVDWTAATTRANILTGTGSGGEALATSMGKIAKWYTDFKSLVFTDLSISNGTAETGKAITSLSYNTSTGVITATKGTFLTSADLSGYIPKTGANDINGSLETNSTSAGFIAPGPNGRKMSLMNGDVTFTIGTSNWASGINFYKTSVLGRIGAYGTGTSSSGTCDYFFMGKAYNDYSMRLENDDTGKMTLRGTVPRLKFQQTTSGAVYNNDTVGISAYPAPNSSGGSTSGVNMTIQSGGNMIIGAGEYPTNFYNLADKTTGYPNYWSTGAEYMFIGSDNYVIIHTKADTIANKKTFVFGDNFNLAVGANITFKTNTEVSPVTHSLTTAATTTSRTWTLPDATGTIALTNGTNSAVSQSDKVYVTADDISGGSYFSVPFFLQTTPSNGYKSLVANGAFKGYAKDGTANVEGTSYLILGNATTLSSASNKTGILRLYSAGDRYVNIRPLEGETAITSNRTIYLPNESGTVSLIPNGKYSFFYDSNSDFASYAWHKFAEITVTEANTDNSITFLVCKTWGAITKETGLLTAHIRTSETKVFSSCHFAWHWANQNINPSDFVLVYTNTAATSCKVELWCKQTARYDGWIFRVLKEHSRLGSADAWTLYKISGHGSASYTVGTGTYTSIKIPLASQVAITDGSAYIKSRDVANVYANSGAATANSLFYTAAFVKTNSGGWSIGTLPSNDKLYFLWTTDENYNNNNNSYTTWTIDSTGLFTGTATYANGGKHVLTDPNSEVYYGLTIHSTAGTEENKYFRTNNGLRALTRIGTTSQIGYGFVVLGNATASGTDGNKYGGVIIYTSGTKYVQISGTNDNYLSFSSSTATAGDGIIPVTTATYDLGASDNLWRRVCCSTGVLLRDNANNVYGGLIDNGTNLWIGASQAATTHHVGGTLISSGYDSSTSKGNPTIKIAVPNATNTGATSYDVYHTGLGVGKDGFISFPNDGQYTASADNITGALVITCPFGMTNIMMSFTVDIYNYIDNECVSYRISGYNYSTGPKWVNCSASSFGDGTKANLTVRFGYNGTKAQIQIGETNTTWKWPQVRIRDILLGHLSATDRTFMSNRTGWTITFVTTNVSNITKTITGTQIYSLSGHTHSADDITSGTLPIARGGTGKTTALEAITNLGGPSIASTGTSIGASSSAPKDLNSSTYTTPGTYHSADSTASSYISNGPTTGSGYKLFVVRGYGSASRVWQIASGNSVGNIWFRFCADVDASTQSWSDWKRICYSDHTHVVDTLTWSFSDATTRRNAVKALTNENVGTDANYFLTITTSWGKAGYTSVSNVKTVLGLGSAAYTASTDYATAGHTHSNYLGASKASTSYYGMTNPDGTDTNWIRTTTQGIIPYQSGNAGSGHQQLGTSTWYFAAAYIDTIYENGTSLANKYIPKAGATDISGSLETNSTSAGFIVPGPNGRKMTLMNGNLTLTIGTSSWSNGIVFYKTSTLGMIGAFGTGTSSSGTCDYFFMGKAYNDYSMRMENDDTGKMTLRGTVPQIKFQQTTTGKTRDNGNDGIIAHPASTNGMNMTIQSSGNMIIGAGEYPTNFYSASKSNSTTYPDYWSDDGEQMYVGSDNNVIIHTNANTIANRKGFMFTTAGNLQLAEGGGIVFKYATSTVEHKLTSAATTTERTWTLPDATGTIALTSNIPATYAGSTTAGGAATTVTITNTENTTEVSKAIPFHDDSTGGPYSLLTNNGLGYRTLNGTASALGISRIVIGNATATGTAGNKYGVVRIYSRQTYYADIRTSTSYNGNRTFTLPNKNGTVAVTGAGTWQNVSSVTDSSAINTYDIKYRKGDASAVEIRGSIKFQTLQASYSLTTLPSEYRPDIDRVFPIMDPDSGGYKGRLRITSAGVVTLQFTAPNVLSTSVTYYFSGMFTV